MLDRLIELGMPLAAVLGALIVGSLLLLLLGKSPAEGYGAMLKGALGSFAGVAQTLTKATPLLLVALGICVAFRGGVINIGGEGQIIAGALAAAALALAVPAWPGWLLLPATLLAGALAGGLWGGIAGVLKARLGVNEILSTIMLNQIALQGMYYLLRGPMLDPEQIEAGTNIPQSAALPAQTWLLRLAPRTQLHSGLFIALVLAILVYLLLWRTTVGYRIRAVGFNSAAARYAGIPVRGYLALALGLSGAFAGLAGAIEVLGVHHRMLEGLTGGYGFSGIVAALFGKLHPLGAVPAAFLFGALLVGADRMQRAIQVPNALIIALQGLVVLFVVASDYYVRRRSRRRVRGEPEAEAAPASPAASPSPAATPTPAPGVVASVAETGETSGGR
jgi:simple sugar transport system permease protein